MHLILCKTRACLPLNLYILWIYMVIHRVFVYTDTHIWMWYTNCLVFVCCCIAFDKSADSLRTQCPNTLKIHWNCTHTLPKWELNMTEHYNMNDTYIIMMLPVDWVVFKFVHSWPIWKTNDSIALQAHSICCHIDLLTFMYCMCRCRRRICIFLSTL